jgi:flagellar motor protein MotB
MDDNNDNNWTLTYGDIMSLLLCFFVMLYAVSTVQKSKVEAATESLRSSFGLFGQQMSEAAVMTARPAAAIDTAGINILFDWGKDELNENAKAALDGFVRRFGTSPSVTARQRITVTGSAAAEEKTRYRRSLDLAYSRSTAVWDYLVSQGIHRERLTVVLETDTEKFGAAVRIGN